MLSGGLVPGSVTLLGGQPGVGKSTLLLQSLLHMGRSAPVMLASAEESPEQVRLRAGRLGLGSEELWITPESILPNLLEAVSEVRPEVLVVDSIQTISDPGLAGEPGSVTQVRGCTLRLAQLAKSRGVSVIVVGHVTKDGSLAGPRVLEHMVDTVLSFDGERHHALRTVRALKHRFGPTGELGLFEMTAAGLRGVPDASRLLLADRQPGAPGALVLAAMDGQRPLLAELQSLVSRPSERPGHRSAQGLDPTRLSLVLAVIERWLPFRMSGCDVFVSIAGGMRVQEPAADLAVALGLLSALAGQPLGDELVAFGEVGLSGELRQVAHSSERLAEAYRVGLRRAVVPRSSPDGPAGMALVRVETLSEAVNAVGLSSRFAAPRGGTRATLSLCPSVVARQ